MHRARPFWLLVSTIVMLCVAIPLPTAFAQIPTTLWQVGEGQWFERGNWSNGVPGTSISAVIGNGTATVDGGRLTPTANDLTIGQSSPIAASSAALQITDVDLALNQSLNVGRSIAGSVAGQLTIQGQAPRGVPLSLTLANEMNVGIADGVSARGSGNVDIVGSIMATGRQSKLQIGVSQIRGGTANGNVSVTGDISGFQEILIGNADAGGTARGQLIVNGGLLSGNSLQIGSQKEDSQSSQGRLLLEDSRLAIERVSVGPGSELIGNDIEFTSLFNAGKLLPGTSIGTRKADQYTQAATGALQFRIGGTTPGQQHDQFVATKSAILAGGLTLGFDTDYQPAIGDTFDLIQAGSLRGAFDRFAVRNPPADVGLRFVGSDQKVSVVIEPVKPLGFVNPSGQEQVSWNDVKNWQGNQLPDSLNAIDLFNQHPQSQLMQIDSNVLVQNLTLGAVGKGAGDMTLQLVDGQQLSATHAIQVGRGGQLNYGEQSGIQASLLQIDRGGRIQGSGDITGNVVNSGYVKPGSSALQIQGNFTQLESGVLEFDFAGAGFGQFDTLVIEGEANLNGLLTLNLENLSSLEPGGSFTLISATEGIVGDFSRVQLVGQAPAGIGFGFSFDDNEVVLFSQTSTLGDMNFDGVADGCDVEDFVLAMRDPLGYFDAHTAPPEINGDTSLDFRFDFDDIEPFLELVGDEPCEAEFASVPEPNVHVLGLATLFGLLGWQRRSRTLAGSNID